MAYRINPFTGNFDNVGIPVGYPRVATYADLPSAATYISLVFLVLTSTGAWYTLNRREAGLYYSDGVSWSRLGSYISIIDDTRTSTQMVWSSDKTKTYADSINTFGDRVGGNISVFESDGTLRFDGTATVYKDIDFPIIVRTTGVGIPTLTTVNGNITMPQWEVNDFNVCESQEFIHEWKEGSTCYWHVHLTTNGLEDTNRYVRFELEYGYSNGDGTAWTFPAVIDTGDLLIPANTADKAMLILSLGNFTPTNAKIGGHCVARLRRIASTGTAPTNNPWIPMLQMHVQCDTTGSRNIGTK